MTDKNRHPAFDAELLDIVSGDEVERVRLSKSNSGVTTLELLKGNRGVSIPVNLLEIFSRTENAWTTLLGD